KREVRIVSHCPLFYWWPVWLVGFGLFLYTFFAGEYMVTVPKHTSAVNKAFKVEKDEKTGKEVKHYQGYLILPEGKTLPQMDPKNEDSPAIQPHLWMSSSKNLGVIFVMVLLFVIVVTNIPFRGLWSAIVIGLIVTLSILFAWLEWWDTILTWFSWLDIRITDDRYLVTSVALALVRMCVCLV